MLALKVYSATVSEHCSAAWISAVPDSATGRFSTTSNISLSSAKKRSALTQHFPGQRLVREIMQIYLQIRNISNNRLVMSALVICV